MKGIKTLILIAGVLFFLFSISVNLELVVEILVRNHYNPFHSSLEFFFRVVQSRIFKIFCYICLSQLVLLFLFTQFILSNNPEHKKQASKKKKFLQNVKISDNCKRNLVKQITRFKGFYIAPSTNSATAENFEWVSSILKYVCEKYFTIGNVSFFKGILNYVILEINKSTKDFVLTMKQLYIGVIPSSKSKTKQNTDQWKFPWNIEGSTINVDHENNLIITCQMGFDDQEFLVDMESKIFINVPFEHFGYYLVKFVVKNFFLNAKLKIWFNKDFSVMKFKFLDPPQFDLLFENSLGEGKELKNTPYVTKLLNNVINQYVIENFVEKEVEIKLDDQPQKFAKFQKMLEEEFKKVGSIGKAQKKDDVKKEDVVKGEISVKEEVVVEESKKEKVFKPSEVINIDNLVVKKGKEESKDVLEVDFVFDDKKNVPKEIVDKNDVLEQVIHMREKSEVNLMDYLKTMDDSFNVNDTKEVIEENEIEKVDSEKEGEKEGDDVKEKSLNLNSSDVLEISPVKKKEIKKEVEDEERIIEKKKESLEESHDLEVGSIVDELLDSNI